MKKIRMSALKNSKIHKTSKVESGSNVINSNFGKYSYCGYDCEIINASIGKFTSIANGVVVGGASHPMNWIGMCPVFYSGRDSISKKFAQFTLKEPEQVNIGNDVWIGRSSIILSGVRIGNGAVIGAGSVVTKDVPPYAVYAGNPAKLIRFRFDSFTIDKLEALAWWDLSDSQLESVAMYVRYIDQFI